MTLANYSNLPLTVRAIKKGWWLYTNPSLNSNIEAVYDSTYLGTQRSCETSTCPSQHSTKKVKHEMWTLTKNFGLKGKYKSTVGLWHFPFPFHFIPKRTRKLCRSRTSLRPPAHQCRTWLSTSSHRKPVALVGWLRVALKVRFECPYVPNLHLMELPISKVP